MDPLAAIAFEPVPMPWGLDAVEPRADAVAEALDLLPLPGRDSAMLQEVLSLTLRCGYVSADDGGPSWALSFVK